MPLICLQTRPSISLTLAIKACFSFGISAAFCFISWSTRVWSPFNTGCSFVSSYLWSTHWTRLTALRRLASSNCSVNFLPISLEPAKVESNARESCLSASLRGSQIYVWIALLDSGSAPFFFLSEGIFYLNSNTRASSAGQTTPPNISACRDLVFSCALFTKPLSSVINSVRRPAQVESKTDALSLPDAASAFCKEVSEITQVATLLRIRSKISKILAACSLN